MAPKRRNQNEKGQGSQSGKQGAFAGVSPVIDPNSSFTPENFEKELKALAAKAKQETWAKTAREQGELYLRPLALLTLTAVYANVSQLSLSPVYGSIPSARWHDYLVMAACFVGWSTNLILGRLLPVKPVYLLPIIALYIPLAQNYLFKLSGTLTAHWGPLVTEALTLLPLIAGSVACAATYLDRADLGSRLPGWLGDALPGMGAWGVYRLAERYSAGAIGANIGRSFLQTRVGMELILGASYAAFAPSKLLLLAIPAALHTGVLNPHAMTPYALDRLNGTLAAQNWTIIDRKESLTGYISVIENKGMGFRVMRCDHSLLGGEWVVLKRNIVSEPVYGVFAMLEAVRLVEVHDRVPDSQAKALVIGMGIGTTPSALIAHGIDTTVVEIDPVVYEYAAKYFHLPHNHTPVIEDAVAYAARLAADAAWRERFDYIVNDVFTGGAEPIELFTLEFLQDLHSLLTPKGIIAINYAGDFTLPPPKIILNTINQVFPSCRIFREHPRNATAVEGEGRDFTNMVIFCRKSGKRKVTFRSPSERDLLNSISRRQFLPPRHEVLDSEFLSDEEGILTRNSTAKLVSWHERSALGHWEIMRTVLPGEVWESW